MTCMYLLHFKDLMWCDLHGHDNELVMVYDHVHIKNNGKELSIESIGISRAGPFFLNI